MAQQFNSIIARQTDHFRGTSSISVLPTTTALPNFRAITDAVYAVSVTGGVSGSFGVHVLGSIGGTTHVIAGLTSLGAGSFVLYPGNYSVSGAFNPIETGKAVSRYQIDKTVPPSTVVFQSGVATAGISATITVSAVMYANR